MKLVLRGWVKVWRSGELLASGPNLVVNGGLTTFASLMAGKGTPTLQKVAFGDSATTPDVTQIALQGTEAQRVTATVSSSGPLLEVDALFPGDSSRLADTTAREFGVFDSAGTMVARWTCSDILVLRTDQLGVTWTIEPSQE
jgi:hypothetical protein